MKRFFSILLFLLVASASYGQSGNIPIFQTVWNGVSSGNAISATEALVEITSARTPISLNGDAQTIVVMYSLTPALPQGGASGRWVGCTATLKSQGTLSGGSCMGSTTKGDINLVSCKYPSTIYYDGNDDNKPMRGMAIMNIPSGTSTDEVQVWCDINSSGKGITFATGQVTVFSTTPSGPGGLALTPQYSIESPLTTIGACTADTDTEAASAGTSFKKIGSANNTTVHTLFTTTWASQPLLVIGYANIGSGSTSSGSTCTITGGPGAGIREAHMRSAWCSDTGSSCAGGESPQAYAAITSTKENLTTDDYAPMMVVGVVTPTTPGTYRFELEEKSNTSGKAIKSFGHPQLIVIPLQVSSTVAYSYAVDTPVGSATIDSTTYGSPNASMSPIEPPSTTTSGQILVLGSFTANPYDETSGRGFDAAVYVNPTPNPTPVGFQTNYIYTSSSGDYRNGFIFGVSSTLSTSANAAYAYFRALTSRGVSIGDRSFVGIGNAIVPTWTPTPTPASTATVTSTGTVTSTPTITPTGTVTHTPTITLTPTITYTATRTRTVTPTRTSTLTPTATEPPEDLAVRDANGSYRQRGGGTLPEDAGFPYCEKTQVGVSGAFHCYGKPGPLIYFYDENGLLIGTNPSPTGIRAGYSMAADLDLSGVTVVLEIDPTFFFTLDSVLLAGYGACVEDYPCNITAQWDFQTLPTFNGIPLVQSAPVRFSCGPIVLDNQRRYCSFWSGDSWPTADNAMDQMSGPGTITSAALSLRDQAKERDADADLPTGCEISMGLVVNGVDSGSDLVTIPEDEKNAIAVVEEVSWYSSNKVATWNQSAGSGCDGSVRYLNVGLEYH